MKVKSNNKENNFMGKFSDRIGKTSPKTIIQKESIDGDLMNALWNGLMFFYFNHFPRYYNNTTYQSLRNLWTLLQTEYFKGRLDEIEYESADFIKQVKRHFFSAEWYEVYNLIEFVNDKCDYDQITYGNRAFEKYCNDTFQKELSAYRFINGEIVPIKEDQEIASVQKALDTQSKFGPIKQHLAKAIKHLSHKPDPDYHNSIKESITAVEALCVNITKDKKTTLGQALKAVSAKHKIHPALSAAFEKLYGYTSDESGIRHGGGLSDDKSVGQTEAVFMLVACSSFINYVIEKISE